MFRYAHTNIIAKDCDKLIKFYKEVFHCTSIGETRDMRGEWLDKLTGIQSAHIKGEHLCMPGYDDKHPTLEIFSYDNITYRGNNAINTCGFVHIAFEVDDVEATLKLLLAAGGGQYGELVHSESTNGRIGTFVYTTDPEGNIVELQSWS